METFETYRPLKKVKRKDYYSVFINSTVRVKFVVFQVSYVPFQNAVVQAKTEKKLLHHILVWGALDDQSC